MAISAYDPLACCISYYKLGSSYLSSPCSRPDGATLNVQEEGEYPFERANSRGGRTLGAGQRLDRINRRQPRPRSRTRLSGRFSPHFPDQPRGSIVNR